MADKAELKERQRAPLATPNNLGAEATKNISGALNALLADVFALYIKTKNFHWHMSGPHFRDYHLLLDEQADQIFAMTDDIAERVRKLGGTTIRSIGHIARLQRLTDNDAEYVDAQDMLAELRDDNQRLASSMLEVHGLCDDAERRRDREPARSLDRRNRAPRLVPLRSGTHPAARRRAAREGAKGARVVAPTQQFSFPGARSVVLLAPGPAACARSLRSVQKHAKSALFLPPRAP